MGTSGVEGISLKGMEYKIPPHVAVTKTWNWALTNALNYGMMPPADQVVEHACFHVADT